MGERMSTYPEIKEGTVIVPWGPGWIDSGADDDGIDAVVIGHDIDMRPEGGTVASIEIIVNDGMGGTSVATGAELTEGDLVSLCDWAFGRVLDAHRDETITKQEIYNLQVAPTFDDGDSVEWIEAVEDMDRLTSWSLYIRVGDPSDQFVKAEFVSDFTEKEDAMRMAFLLSAGRWPIEVLDPR
jgi:hypothetical protein